jgi:hypothetical protein
MRLIEIASASPNILIRIGLEDGGTIQLTLNFRSNQRCWFYSISGSNGLSLNNRRLVNSPNMLRQFRNNINFGLSCIVSDGGEPWFLNDFETGRVKIYELSIADMALVEAHLKL